MRSALVSRVAFVKFAHHGSGNATPQRFIDMVLPGGRMAMLPWGLVERWKNTIPQKDLMAALDAHHHTVVHADAPQAIPGRVDVHDDLWSEITFALPWVLRRYCNGCLRQAVVDLSDGSRQSHPWAQAIYAKAHARGARRADVVRVPGPAPGSASSGAA